MRLWPLRVMPSLAFRAWLTPPPIGSRTIGRDQETTADLEPFRVGEIGGFEIGSGPPVLLVHGWGGRPAQMAALGRALAESGYRAVVPELPGHAGGEQTDIKIAAAALNSVIEKIGVPAAIVGHSFAAMILRLAFADDDAPHQIVLIAPALDVNDALDVFGDRLQLFPWARRGLRNRLEKWDPTLWPVLSSLQPEQFPDKSIDIFHDQSDQDASFARSAELAAVRPDTRLHVVEGLGHSRLLSDAVVISEIVGIVAEAVTQAAVD